MTDNQTLLRRKIFNLISVGALVAVLLQGAIYYGRHTLLSPQEIARQYHIMMYSSPAMQSLRWLGIPTNQNPNDVWIIQEIIAETKPDWIIETGTAYGGSAVIWSLIQQQVNPDGRVITIDIQNLVEREKLPQQARDKVSFVLGSSVAPEVVAEVTQRVRGKRVLVLLDSDHHSAHVLRELESYSPLVNIGSYIIVQDTDIGGHPIRSSEPGPMKAVEAFLAANPQFEPDLAREKLIFTMHPKGFLRRIR